jgi:hypothetical protein
LSSLKEIVAIAAHQHGVDASEEAIAPPRPHDGRTVCGCGGGWAIDLNVIADGKGDVGSQDQAVDTREVVIVI